MGMSRYMGRRYERERQAYKYKKPRNPPRRCVNCDRPIEELFGDDDVLLFTNYNYCHRQDCQQVWLWASSESTDVTAKSYIQLR